MELPKFKYSPNAYKIGVFKEEKGICSVCGEKRNIKYTTPFHGIEKPEYICPFCIADGKAAKKYNGAFIDYADGETVKPFIDELEEDIKKFGFEREEILESLSKDGSCVGYLFQCMHCGKHRLHIDYD